MSAAVRWGGWITGPTAIGPEEFARAGYHYVGIDTQHGYFDDAGAARLLRRLSGVPITTLVRLPSADPAPIGRVLDAGADGVIIALVESAEQAADAVAAACYPPTGVRSFGPLRADLGTDLATLATRTSVYVMIETVRGVQAAAEICAVPGLAGVYVGPADLAISMGVAVADGLTDTRVLGAIDDIQALATAAGITPGIHAGTGAAGRMLAARGYTMLTLAAESQALRRGAAEFLAEAAGTEPSQTATGQTKPAGGYQ
ncbi:HpcH/HpaI aldolase family protein [Mycolicibacterium fallax]|uniref:Aldolase n=1 Tax=Mycolicibacterium fallax TaxID=1793 RepID=A0A1X1RJH9_MYCFA|nr:aldolase/citrate lyase family protein [Mycolicibacterium fallax]ORV07767.1 aldolase [Mycolicibacterium fallax]BBY99158.1 aldolase [Mycolicibacterium fallax]HSA40256.1 aldolase/citrate lyase family protein [Mycobacterium sp.]